MSRFEGFDEGGFNANGIESGAGCGGERARAALLLLHCFPQTHGAVEYRPLPAGHFIPEEMHQEAAQALRGFFV